MASGVSDLGDTIGSALGRIAREATHAVSQNGRGRSLGGGGHDGVLSGMRGVAAGAAVAAAAPFAARRAQQAVKRAAGKRLKSSSLPDPVKQMGRQVLRGGGRAGESAGGGGGRDKRGTPGVGKGRRMPVQQMADIGVPLSVVYNQWTQFEEWPEFMHRLMQVTQEDDCTVSFKAKLWGMSKEFVAEIVEQRPDERIQWNVTQGVTHTGVVTFHELGPRLTRVMVTLDVEPGSLIEKAARGMRHVKRAVRADLARFKAFIEMQEVESGAWRGTIHDGEVVEQHPRSYDRGREYAGVEDIHDREHSHTPREPERAREPEAASARSERGGASRSSSSRPRSRPRRRASGRSRSRSDGQHRRNSGDGSGESRRRRSSTARSRG
jgi:uncharacterized membrane protein